MAAEKDGGSLLSCVLKPIWESGVAEFAEGRRRRCEIAANLDVGGR